jgi:hypothetical protein
MKEKCAICGKTIAKDPIPYYQAKVKGNQPKMWKHAKCPGVHEVEEV